MSRKSSVWCEEHQKWGFTKNMVKKVHRRAYESRLKIYPCKGLWHVGHSIGPNKRR